MFAILCFVDGVEDFWGFPRVFTAFRSRRSTRLVLLAYYMEIVKSGLSKRRIVFEEASIDDLKRKILDLIIIEGELEFHR